MSSLNDHAYLVVGATGGTGSALARRLVRDGARVGLMAREGGPLEDLAAELQGHAVAGDASSFESVESAATATREWAGRLDGIVNAVGNILLKPAHLTSEAELEEVWSRNVRTAFAAVRAAAKVCEKGAGSVLLFSSAAAGIGLPNHEAIAAGKGAVEGLVRSAAATYAAKGLRVNAIAPGLVRSAMSERIVGNPASLKASEAMHPLGRIGEPEDLVGCGRWLLGPESSWVTGQIIGVDGGLATLKTPPARR